MTSKEQAGIIFLQDCDSMLKNIQGERVVAHLRMVGIAVSLLALSFSQQAGASEACHAAKFSVEISRESYIGAGKDIEAALASIKDPHFTTFVKAINDHVRDKAKEVGFCDGSSNAGAEIQLSFVYVPLLTNQEERHLLVPDLDVAVSRRGCSVVSPWVKLQTTRSPAPRFQSVIVWSERQFLIDQAVMAGASRLDIQAPASFTLVDFGGMLGDYESAVLRAPTPEAQAQAQAMTGAADRLPPEVFWLFRQAGLASLAPFVTFVNRALASTIDRASTGYLDLTKVLLDQCWALSPVE